MSNSLVKTGFILAASVGFLIVQSGSIAKLVKSSKEYIQKKKQDKFYKTFEPEKHCTL